MARARITQISKREYVPRENCSHLAKDHAVLAHSATKQVQLCTRCGAHLIVTELGKPIRKYVFDG